MIKDLAWTLHPIEPRFEHLPPQAQVIANAILTRVISGMTELNMDEAAKFMGEIGLQTKQDPMRIFYYYHKKLESTGLMVRIRVIRSPKVSTIESRLARRTKKPAYEPIREMFLRLANEAENLEELASLCDITVENASVILQEYEGRFEKELAHLKGGNMPEGAL